MTNFSPDALKRISQSVFHTERELMNPVPDGASGGQNPNQVWWPFLNSGSSTIPGYGLIEFVDATAVTGGDRLLGFTNGKLPTNTFTGLYGVNSARPVEAGDTGMYTVTSPCLVAYEGSPAAKEGWGVKGGQGTAAKGYPGLKVIGIWSSANKLMLATLDCPIRSLLAKANSDIAAASGTSTVTPGSGTCKVWVDTGSGYVESSGPMTFTGYNTTGSAATAGVLTAFIEDQGRMIVAGGVGDAQKLVKTTSSVASGASGTVNIWNNGSGGSETISTGPITATAWNRTSVTIASGKFCLMTPLTIGGATVLYLQPWEC